MWECRRCSSVEGRPDPIGERREAEAVGLAAPPIEPVGLDGNVQPVVFLTLHTVYLVQRLFNCLGIILHKDYPAVCLSTSMVTTLTTYLGQSDQDISEAIERRLDYGASKSEWCKVALRDRLAIEHAAEHAGISLPNDRRERDAVLRQAIVDLSERRGGGFEAVEAE